MRNNGYFSKRQRAFGFTYLIITALGPHMKTYNVAFSCGGLAQTNDKSSFLLFPSVASSTADRLDFLWSGFLISE